MIVFKRFCEGIVHVVQKSSGKQREIGIIRKSGNEWVLESSSGRIDRFEKYREAREEALKILV